MVEDPDARVDEHLLVLFVPGVQGLPVEPDGSPDPGRSILVVDACRTAACQLADPQPVAAGSASRQRLRVVLVDQQGTIDIGERDVVLRGSSATPTT